MLLISVVAFIAMAVQQPQADSICFSGGATVACDQVYSVTCTLSGVDTDCLPPMGANANADRIELHDGNGKVWFEKGVSGDARIISADFSEEGYPDRPTVGILFFAVEPHPKHKPELFSRYFEVDASGLHAFSPELSCGVGEQTHGANRDAAPPSGIIPICFFRAGSMRVVVDLRLDFEHHRIVPAPESKRMFVSTASGKAVIAVAGAEFRLYRKHNKTMAGQSPITIPLGGKFRVVSVWAPVRLKSDSNIGTVNFDLAGAWFEINSKGKTGWVPATELVHDLKGASHPDN